MSTGSGNLRPTQLADPMDFPNSPAAAKLTGVQGSDTLDYRKPNTKEN